MQTANERAVRLGLDNVSFRQADLATWQPTETFDALTGRLITMYLPNPSAVIASLSRALRPGGIVLLQEFAMSAARPVDGAALVQRTLDWLLAAFRAVGAPTDLGYDLGRVFRGAGLGTPTMTVAARWEDGPDAMAYGLLAGIIRTLLPVITAHHIATAAEVDIDTLEDRLRDDQQPGAPGSSRPCWSARRRERRPSPTSTIPSGCPVSGSAGRRRRPARRSRSTGWWAVRPSGTARPPTPNGCGQPSGESSQLSCRP